MQRRRRRTNFLRPMYRLGWLLIWSLWGISLLFGIPAVMPHDDVVGWGFVALAVTAVAYLAHRLWDWWVVGRPLPSRR
ncbi:MAG: hypothetical protein HN428_01165 [Proteobacteria bacterium]|nr:hypothetical protein [Pseudomonadota bacterium]